MNLINHSCTLVGTDSQRVSDAINYDQMKDAPDSDFRARDWEIHVWVRKWCVCV